MSGIYTSFLVLGLLISGVSIPLILSYQDHHIIDDQNHLFTQPLLQTVMIFIGEIMCIFGIQVISKASSWLDRSLLDSVQGNRQQEENGNEWMINRTSWFWSGIWFIIPSACDLISTTMLNLGLIYSTPSIFQMMRSSIVGFSAVFSFLFLSRRFLGHEWVSVITILGGIVIITYYAAVSSSTGGAAPEQGTLGDNTHPWFGPLLLLFSQVFVACQFILEEYLMDRYQMDPVRAMGIEGAFGTVLLGITVIVAALTPSAADSVFDIKTGMAQLIHSYDLWQSAIVLAIMVAIFNFFGLAVSTTVGIPGRSVLDAIRTTLIWVIATHYGYDTFSWLQFIGFVILIVGVFIFNGVFFSITTAVRQRFFRQEPNGERAPLLS
ncbi:uncharacterized protein BX664DRAFT_330937 [Halteromyces radiatus]|uniref:uncharacterized protein n=1 Tax=Halteromyces radiatus TaxID=101107 RepID=UPI00221E4431|nr:uncharacterized protein BX664DRAFT_330937 [Halteromyces radiatus]KAI8093903.1 hypothetical protein BX664DRAFT_330937 [Halteromyces radiatus]